MNLEPLDDRVFVAPDEPKKYTESGLTIPDGAQEKVKQGTVVAAGPGRALKSGLRAPMAVASGDKIMFGEYGGELIEYEGEKVLVLREGDIFGVLYN